MLVWMALAGLPPAERTKVVHVISTDTGVENPVVAAWVNASLDSMRRAAAEQGLPIEAHRLTPAVEDSFWLCLIGRGYAAPRPKFRWRTERLKVKPSNAFIRAVVAAFGEVILVLGTRKAESRARARTMTRYEKRRVRDRLSPNGSLPNSLVYSPIEDLSNDEVWESCSCSIPSRGAQQQGLAHHVPGGVSGRRVPAGRRFHDAVVRRQPVRLLDLHAGLRGQVDAGRDQQ
ncbi:hypothetical protein ABZ599_32855 [Streptomyces misionensis]|uniref:hypothetical protein n=1 Tax=Streptomyces misionensis TaxID=67331 RepID=UPI0033F762ED